MSSSKITRTSKFLSYILRHNPSDINLDLNEGGWADIDQLIEKARENGRNLNRELIKRVVYEGDKNRFSISNEGRYIRANYGHSIELNLDYKSEPPPALLFHGTATRNIDSIRQNGLHSGNRKYVHLSPDRTSARQVGARHGSPVILKIDAGRMHAEGHLFYPTEGNIWLTASVPPDYIDMG